jgi:hypothetical protein
MQKKTGDQVNKIKWVAPFDQGRKYGGMPRRIKRLLISG